MYRTHLARLEFDGDNVPERLVQQFDRDSQVGHFWCGCDGGVEIRRLSKGGISGASCRVLLSFFFIYSTRSTGVEIDGREVEDVLGGEGETRRDEVRCSRKEFKRGTRITFITREEGGKVHPGGGE
jgi:hypothetical protein